MKASRRADSEPAMPVLDPVRCLSSTADISIIIPAKNEALYLGRCITAVKLCLARFEGRAEIIVVDNGSVDSTAEIAGTSGCTVLSYPGGTIAGARNAGARIASGSVLGFLDADCLVSPMWIRTCLARLHGGGVGVVGTPCIPESDNRTWVEQAWYTVMMAQRKSGTVEWVGTSNFCINRDLFWSVGGFDEKLETAEDVNLCNRLRNADRPIYLETSVNTVHLRESKTIRDLFQRELRRGTSSLGSLVRSPALFQELPVSRRRP